GMHQRTRTSSLATARATATSNDPAHPGRRPSSSARPWTASMPSRPSRSMTACKNRTRLSVASSSTIDKSGRAILSGTPGKPAPDPTSTTRAPRSKTPVFSTVSESTKCFSVASRSSVMRVRFVCRFVSSTIRQYARSAAPCAGDSSTPNSRAYCSSPSSMAFASGPPKCKRRGHPSAAPYCRPVSLRGFSPAASDVPRRDDHAPLGLFSLAVRLDARHVRQRQVHDPPLQGVHRLQRDLAPLSPSLLRHAPRHGRQRSGPPLPVALRVQHEAHPDAAGLVSHLVDQKLQRIQRLPAPADNQAQVAARDIDEDQVVFITPRLQRRLNAHSLQHAREKPLGRRDLPVNGRLVFRGQRSLRQRRRLVVVQFRVGFFRLHLRCLAGRRLSLFSSL